MPPETVKDHKCIEVNNLELQIGLNETAATAIAYVFWLHRIETTKTVPVYLNYYKTTVAARKGRKKPVEKAV